MFVTNWISTTKIQKISEITNFFRHYFLSRTEVKEEYELLAQNEMKVKNLVKEKWVNAISTRIESELSRSVEQLKSQLSAISDRYDQTLPSIDKEVEDYESRVSAHLTQMGFVL